MKITIDANFDHLEEPQELMFTDDGLDNPNFVNVRIADQYFDVSVEDLFIAAQAFNNIRLGRKYERDLE